MGNTAQVIYTTISLSTLKLVYFYTIQKKNMFDPMYYFKVKKNAID